MGHKYLQEVINKKPFYQKITLRGKLLKQRAQYSFDEREVYDLNYTFYCWLYERVNMFIDVASEMTDLHHKRLIWKGVEYTQFDLMQELLIRLKFYFKATKDFLILSSEEEKMITEIGEIWAVLLPEMWW